MVNRIFVKGIRNPFSGQTERREVELHGGESVSDAVRRAFGGGAVFNHYNIDGKPCQPSDTIPCGAREIKALAVPLEAVTWASVGAFLVKTLVVAAASAAIGAAVSYLTRKKVPTKYNKQLSDVSDEQYGWDYDARNAVAEGAPVPVLYGERLLTPPVVMQKARTQNSSGDSTLEIIYAVAEGGGGFSDSIEYPLDGNGNVQARINHASWLNFNSEAMGSASDATKNWMRPRNSGINVYVNYDITNSTGGYPCPLLTDGRTDDKWNDFDNFLIAADIHNVNNLYWNVGTSITPTSVKVYSHFVRGQLKGVAGFSLFGKKLDGTWERVGATTNYVGTGNMVCTLTVKNPDTSVKYSQYYIGSIAWKSAGIHGNYGAPSLCEVVMYGTRSNGSTGMGGSAMIQVNTGSFNQEPHSLQDGTWASLAVEKTLDTNDFVFRTSPGAYPDRIGIHLSFPYGLYSIDDRTGDISSKTVRIVGKYRAYGATEWIAFDGLSINGTNVSGSEQRQKLLYYEQDVSAIGAESYEVCVRFAVDPSPAAGEQCECVWSGIDEGWAFDCSYPRTATALLKMLATQLVNGSAPQFRILARRAVLNVYDSVNEAWVQVSASNPAWAAYDLIVRPVFDDRTEDTEPGDGTLIREAYPHSGLVFSEFKEWADFCDANDITMSMYYDGTTTVKSALEYVCEIGRASIVNRGAILGVHIDRRAEIGSDGNPVPVFRFDDSNVIADSYKCTYRSPNELYTQVNVTFYDREREYNRFTVMARDPESDGREQNIRDVTLFCCDRRDVAQAYAQYILDQNKIRRTFEWKGDLDAMPLDIGDVVKLYDDYVVLTSVSFDKQLGRSFTGAEYVDERFNQKTIKQKLAEAINERMLAKSANVMTHGGTWAATSYDGTEEASVLALAARDAMIGFASKDMEDGASVNDQYAVPVEYGQTNTGISLEQGDFFNESAWMKDCYDRVRSAHIVYADGGAWNFSHFFDFASEKRTVSASYYVGGMTEEQKAQQIRDLKWALENGIGEATPVAGTSDTPYADSSLSTNAPTDMVDGAANMRSMKATFSQDLTSPAVIRLFFIMEAVHELGEAYKYDSFGVTANYNHYKMGGMWSQPAGENAGVQSPGIFPAGAPYFTDEQDAASPLTLEWYARIGGVSLDYAGGFVHNGPMVDEDVQPELPDDSRLLVTVSSLNIDFTKTDPDATGDARMWENTEENGSIYYSVTRGRWYLSLVESGVESYAIAPSGSNPWEVEWDDPNVTVSLYYQ